MNIQDRSGVAYDDMPTTRFHLLVSGAAAGGQFSDGYILGTIGIALSQAQNSLHLTPLWLGLLGGASLAGLFLGSLLLGPLADRFGRRPLLLPTMAIFTAISILQFFVTTPVELLILRLLLGLTLGVDYVVCCTVVAEFSPARTRGRLLSFLVFMWYLGYTTAFIFGTYLASTLTDAWRVILLSGAAPSALVFLARLRIPESPPWLVRQGRIGAARDVVTRYLGQAIQLPVSPAAKSQKGGLSWSELFGAKYRTRTAVGAIFYTAQVIPLFALGTFVPTVFAALGISDGYTSGIIFNAFLLLGTAAGLWLIDKVTRRQFLLWTFYLTTASLLFLAVASSAPPPLIVVAAALFAFLLAAATNLDYVYLPELFPTRLRASGVGVGTAASRIGSALSTFMLPQLVEAIGIRPTLGLCVGILFAGGVFCHAFAPETRGHSIEEEI